MDQFGFGKACGKFILLGEHFAVHGSKVIAFPIGSLLCEVTIGGHKKGYEVPCVAPTNIADQMSRAFLKACDELGLNLLANVFSKSNFELSKGFGSSAAYSVALVRAVVDYAQKNNLRADFSNQKLERVIHSLECLFHGSPSGVDGATIFYNKPICFQKNKAAQIIRNSKLDFILLDSGPRQSSAELVNKITLQREKNPRHWQKLTSQIENLIARSLNFFSHDDQLESSYLEVTDIINRAQNILAELGLSNERIDKLIDRSLEYGVLAGKVSGAGAGGAVVLATRAGAGQAIAKKLKENDYPVVAVVDHAN
jgi:mevalonate kinase